MGAVGGVEAIFVEHPAEPAVARAAFLAGEEAGDAVVVGRDEATDQFHDGGIAFRGGAGGEAGGTGEGERGGAGGEERAAGRGRRGRHPPERTHRAAPSQGKPAGNGGSLLQRRNRVNRLTTLDAIPIGPKLVVVGYRPAEYFA